MILIIKNNDRNQGKEVSALAATKHSRQRDAIKAYLLRTRDHPTADMVYQEMRAQFPHISLATVYRNLNLLAAQGEILRIPGPEGDRFDGDTREHYHFTCRCCGEVYDLPPEIVQTTVHAENVSFGGRIESVHTSFSGICPKCLKLPVHEQA